MISSENQLEYGNFVPRSRQHILNYPVGFRWEITRRHPYYLALWRLARKNYQSTSLTDTTESKQALAAMLALGAIGVTGDPIPPETAIEQFLDSDPIFLCGSVQPMTIRYLISLLLTSLDPDNQEYFGKQFSIAAGLHKDLAISDYDRMIKKSAMLAEISKRQDKILDSVFLIPLFYFHLEASQETIKEDANRQAKLWKERRGLGSTKIHTAKLPMYLEVWDAIEGWTGSAYDISREQKFKDLASSTKKSISTLHDQYRAAFHAIVGAEFSPPSWWNTLGRYKLAQLQDQVHESHVWLARHRLKAADHFTSRHSEAGRRQGNASPIEPDQLEIDSPERVLWEQIVDRIQAGLSVEQIKDDLGLVTSQSEALIAFIREKAEAMKSLSK